MAKKPKQNAKPINPPCRCWWVILFSAFSKGSYEFIVTDPLS